ncbi:MAG: class II fructose-bisphosphate aldolase [Planctomycetota bacterium]|nr:class II fructose-bisphosphate aldolase [Planctomycetota bacterium]MEC9007727.1 class II fructose-bisphosphate aldolase [Planctomycetota bacterium]MED5446660.1 class II fructose-bisphosphate aldolase [Planctomycetota bacterium]MEE3367300.1 class II fructose-bisphosphate aldolase [Planctomycetota bacterium]
MPVATPSQYAAMIDAAQEGDYAFPAINVTSLVTINAALKAFADQRCDGIIQISLGGGGFASGLNVADNVVGAIVLAEAAHRLAAEYDILVGLHTDHCQPDKVDSFLRPLIAATAARRAAGQGNLFQSHMLDASELPLEENMALSRDVLAECAAEEIILEVEAGVVGGEEDGVDNTMAPAEKLYTSPEDMLYVHEQLSGIGRYLFAATFGNVHGHYKPGVVQLKPEILRDGQAAVIAENGEEARFDLVFHGGSGTPVDQIRETLGYGVVKMNIDTDTQYAFTRPVVDHVLKNYDGVLKVDGEIGVKKAYDPRSYLKAAEAGVASRLATACEDLLCSGKTIAGTV